MPVDIENPGILTERLKTAIKSIIIPLIKSEVGLNNVDNTSDADKPVSNAQQILFNSITESIEEITQELEGKADSSGLGTASTKNVEFFATAAQGNKADNAVPNNLIGSANGIAPLDSNAKIDPIFLPVDGSFMGTWNADTNTPAITSGEGIIGQYYVVNVPGTTNIDGNSTWNIGDQIRFNGVAWQRIPSVSIITSVNGKTGIVVLTAEDIPGLGDAATKDVAEIIAEVEATLPSPTSFVINGNETSGPYDIGVIVPNDTSILLNVNGVTQIVDVDFTYAGSEITFTELEPTEYDVIHGIVFTTINMVNVDDLGSAAQADITDFATAAQGTKADSALQPSTGVFRIDTFANAPSTTIPAAVKRVYIEDRGAHFKEVVSEPSHALKFVNSGRWFELDEKVVYPEMAGAIGDNVADDTTACAAIVQYAKLTGAPIYASDADFKTTASIIDFHNVVWNGPGRIWRGTNVWHVENGRSDTNVLYLSPTGNNANDGLGDGQPKATLQGALNDFANYGPTLRGKWKVQSAAGTYTSASAVVATIPFGLSSEKLIEIVGPDVGGHPNVPTAFFDGTSASTVGIRGVSGAKFKVKDIAFVNWTRTQLAAVEDSVLATENVHFDFAGAVGIDAQRRCSLYVSGGIFDMGAGAGSNACIQELFNVYHAIGYKMDETNGNPIDGDMPILRGSGTGRGITVREGSTGHVNADVDGFLIGLEVGANSRAHVDPTASFSKNQNAIWLTPGGDLQLDAGINFHDGTADANTRNIVRREASTASPTYPKAVSRSTVDRLIVPGTVANVAATETFLASMKLNAGEWKGAPVSNYAGKALRIRAVGSITGTVGTKVLRFRIGSVDADVSGTNLISASIAAGVSGQFIMEMDMYVVGAASQRTEIEVRVNGASPIVAHGSNTIDLSVAGDLFLKLTGLVNGSGDAVTLSGSFGAMVEG